MTASGFDSIVGYAAESPSGTYTAPTRSIEHVQESLKLNVERLKSKGIKQARRHQGRWLPGRQWVDGKVKHELAPQNFGLLLKQLLGANVDSGAGPYVHTMTPGATVETASLTIQVTRPSEDGTARVFSYLGCQFNGATITSKIGEIAMVEFDVVGQHEDTSQSQAAAAYTATFVPFSFLHGTMTIAAAAYEFDEISVTFDNALQTKRHTHRTTTPSRPKISKEAGHRKWGGTITSDFFDLTAYNRFVNGTEAALSLTWSAGASAILNIAGNVRFDGETPSIEGPQLTKLKLPFEFVSLTSDAAAMTAVLTNAEATP